MIFIPGRIPIYIHPFFWVLIIILGWINSETMFGTFLWASVITFSVLFHEFGHALTAVAFGQKAEIDLVGLGGMTRRSGPRIKLWQEFLVVLNGPLAGFILYFIVRSILPLFKGSNQETIQELLIISLYVNFIWTILNLLPILPLDGGHLLRIILEGAFGLRGTKIAFFISIVLAALGGLFFLLRQNLLMSALFLMMAFESYRTWASLKLLSKEDTNRDLQALLKEGIDLLEKNNLEQAYAKFSSLRNQTKEGVLFISATQYMARILAQEGRINEAYAYLYPVQNKLPPEYVRFLQQLAFRLQKWQEAIDIGTDAYRKISSAEVAMINAYASAILGHAKAAVGWLRSAKQMGLPNLNKIVYQREFDAIRNTSDFQEFLRSID